MREIWIALIAATPPTIASSVAIVMAIRAKNRSDVLHVQMNSRMDELLESTRAQANATGEARGRMAERDRADEKEARDRERY